MTTDPNWRKRPRFWTGERIWRLAEMLEQQRSDTEIAAALGTTANAVNLARKRRRIKPRTKQAYSAAAVARVLGLGCAKTVGWWIEQGWLVGRRGQPRGGNRQWVVAHEALTAFLEDPKHWHRWDPERINPTSGLKSWAREMRSGVRFLTQAEVADRFYVQVQTVGAWIDRGQLRAVDNGNRVIRESDLEGFVPPGQRFRGGYRIRHWSAEEDRRLLALRAAGNPWARIADALGRTIGSSYNRHARLTCGEAVAA